MKRSHTNGSDKADSGVFTGSRQTEERGKAFESTGDDERGHPNGHRDDYVYTHGDPG